MIVWKRSKSLITGKESLYPKFVDTPIIRIFNDFDWWKLFVSKYSWWVYKNRTSLPEKFRIISHLIIHFICMNMIKDIVVIDIGKNFYHF